MKKIILTIFAAATLLGCNQESITEVPSSLGAISFSNVSTRAGLSDLVANGFGVWSLMYNEAQQDGYWVFENTHISLGSDGWKYADTDEDLRYWVNNSFYFFAAVYPQENVTTATRDNQKVVVIDIATPVDTTPEDILIATPYVDTSREYDETVGLTFKHLHSRVNIKVKKDEGTNMYDHFIIDKITLKSVKSKASVVLLSSVDPVWEYDTSVTNTYSRDFEGDTPIGLAGEVLLSDEGLVLLPQDPSAVKLEISFRFAYGDGTTNIPDLSLFKSETYSVNLPTSIVPVWESGKSYTYTALLSMNNDIKFLAPSIEYWGGAQSGGTVIIK